MNLIIKDDNFEFLESISKMNNILVLNKKNYFAFYYYFYDLIRNKNKDLYIKLGEKRLDFKNTILFSLIDFNELLDNLNFKKSTLFYEYMSSLFVNFEFLDNDILIYDLENIIKNLLTSSKLSIDYDLDEDIEKLLFNFVDFHLKFDLKDFAQIFTLLLDSFLNKNANKTVIIFYDSSIIPLNLNNYDNCYSFDISNNHSIEKYNLMILEEMREFNINYILDKLESVWPVEFSKNEIAENIKSYFLCKKANLSLIVYDEFSLLTYNVLDKMYGLQSDYIYKKFDIRDNIKSFLEHI